MATRASSVAHFIRRRRLWIAGVAVALAVAALGANVAFDEPLRRSIERQMNERLDGYSVTIAHADLQPFAFAVALDDLIVRQAANPEPPVMHIPRMRARVHWKALLVGRLVGNMRITRPALNVNLAHLRREAEDDTPVTDRGWQDALQAMYPLKINRLHVVDGSVTYTDGGPAKPLQLKDLDVEIENIRNVRSRDREYPSEVHVRATVFDTGRLALDGHGDFLAVPHPALAGAVRIEAMQLDYFRPVAARFNVGLTRGALSAAGTFEYAPKRKAAVLEQVTIAGAQVEYTHRPETARAERGRAAKTAEAAKAATDHPEMDLAIERLEVTRSTVAFVNQAAKPPYRVVLTDASLEVTGLSNKGADGLARASLRGRFMGSGPTEATATFRPGRRGGDLAFKVSIDDTDMVAMNDLLRAYGKFDVVAGRFSLYTEARVNDGAMSGYVKPLFKDVKAYDPAQDRDKSAVQKLKEKLVGGIAKVLKNQPRGEVATRVDLAGRLDNPRTSTLQAAAGLVQNAFFRAILPGFDQALGSRPS